MSFNFPGNPPLPLNSVPPPPPPSMGPPMQMTLMGPQQGHQLGPPLMHGQMMMGPPVMGPQGFAMGPGPLMPTDPHHARTHCAAASAPGSIMNPSLNDAPLEFNTNKNKPPMPLTSEELERKTAANMKNDDVIEIVSRDGRRDRDRDRDRDKDRDPRDSNRRNRDRCRDRERDRGDRDRRDERDMKESSSSTTSSNSPASKISEGQENGGGTSPAPGAPPGLGGGMSSAPPPPWTGMVGPPMHGPYSVLGMNHMMAPPGIMDPSMMYGMMGGGMLGADGSHPVLAPDGSVLAGDGPGAATPTKEIIHCKSCTLFPPNPNLPPPTTRERPPGCKTIFVGGLPENATEEMIREIFGRCGEMLTVRLSNKKFCHIRFVHESSVDEALYFSGYKMRIGSHTDLANSGRLHVDFAQARDDQYEWECRQRQLQREQRHRDRVEKERMRVPSPPPIVHYTDHEASLVVDKIKNDETFTKAMQVVITWLERGDCNKRNANTFYSMIQTTNSHVRRLLSEKAQYEQELQKAKDLMKGRMQGILIQFSQIERVFVCASHKKVWDHFTKPQRKNIEMWKKQATEIKTIELEENLNAGLDEEMEVSESEDDVPRKKLRKENDSISCLKDENDSLRCQLEAYKNEIDIVRCDLKSELDLKEKQLKLVQQTLQGMQQQLIESKKRQNENELKVVELQARLAKEARTDETGDGSFDATNNESPAQKLSEKDARLIGLISVFLHVHPFGAGVDYIWSYLHKMDSTIKPNEVELLMSRFPTVFHQELSGIGAHMERRWSFGGFNNDLPQDV